MSTINVKNTTPTTRRPATTTTCLCSPTNHPGSFRCHLHRNPNPNSAKKRASQKNSRELAIMAKANSLKALLLHMIKPSSHDLQRRRNFKPKPSRFYLLNFNGLAIS